MPEVSLVAILDADREGYLRSDASLIQTIGRAARNLRGKAILYADRITGSMERAIAETERRRAKQLEFNEEHGITPRSVQKKIADIMEGARAGVPGKRRDRVGAGREADEAPMSAAELSKRIAELEKQMFRHAELLEFEDAARIRDQVRRLRDHQLKEPEVAVAAD